MRGGCCTGSRREQNRGITQGRMQGTAVASVRSTQTEVVPKCSFDPLSSLSSRLSWWFYRPRYLRQMGAAGPIDVSAPLDGAAAADAAVVKDGPVAADAPVAADLPLLADAPWVPDVALSADVPVALDTSVASDTRAAIDAFVAIDLAAAGDGGAKAGDGGAGDGGSGPPPVYLPDGGNQGLVADDTGCSFGRGRPGRGAALIPLVGLVALWIVRRRGRR